VRKHGTVGLTALLGLQPSEWEVQAGLALSCNRQTAARMSNMHRLQTPIYTLLYTAICAPIQVHASLAGRLWVATYLSPLGMVEQVSGPSHSGTNNSSNLIPLEYKSFSCAKCNVLPIFQDLPAW
jgi:hypothetical protein